MLVQNMKLIYELQCGLHDNDKHTCVVHVVYIVEMDVCESENMMFFKVKSIFRYHFKESTLISCGL